MNQTAHMPENPDQGDILPELHNIVRLLHTGLHDIEPGFDALSQSLQTVYAQSEHLNGEITTLAQGMSGEGEDTLLGYIANLVNHSLSVLTGCRSTIAGSLSNITAGTGHLSDLCTICEKIKKSAHFLNIIGLNISVESSRTKDAMRMFENFGEDIKSLARTIGEISGTIHKDSQTVQADQAAVHTDIAGAMQRFDALSESTEAAVGRAREEMDSIGNLAAMTLKKAGDHSREISRMVGEIVMSIQFHDIARQQVEHIISAVEDVSALLEKGSQAPDNPETEDDRVNKGRSYTILALQAAQLKQVVADAQTAFHNMTDAFSQIGNEINLLMDNVAPAESDHIQEMDLGREVKHFQTELEKLQHLLTDGNTLEDKIKKSMDRSAATVSTLAQYTDQVSNINIDLQYKAINAMIMTNKLGSQGATLGVLARNVRDLSGVSNTQVGEILKVIQAITDLAQMSDQTQGNDDIRALDTDLAEASGRISSSFERYEQTCAHAGEKAGEIVQVLEETRQDLIFLQSWIDNSQGVVTHLDTLLAALDPWKEMAAHLPPGVDDDIAQRYTMESERRIHEQLTGSGSKDDTDGEAADSDAGDLEDLDDNIELF